MESSSVKFSEPGERSVAGKTSKMGGGGGKADEGQEAVKSEAAAAPEEASDQAAEEDMMMMMMGLADEAEEEMMMEIKSGMRRRGGGGLSMEEILASLKDREAQIPREARTDLNAYQARVYRESWDWLFAGIYGPFDKTTSIPPSCFTGYSSRNPYASPEETLQIFSIKVGEIKKPLKWPLHVFGSIAARDVVDHNRIMVFHRERDNCQTLTKKDRYLTLTGPTRGVVASVHPTYIEVDLKVKGTTESEDRDLSYLLVASFHGGPCYRSEASKLSTLELTYIRLLDSVEATISVKVKGGSWPGCQGSFTARTASFEHMEVLLLAFKGDKLPIASDGKFELSRRVVCVELPQAGGKLVFSAQALHRNKKDVLGVRKIFTPKTAGKSKEIIKIGYCEMEVTVTWSLLPSSKYD